MDERRLIAQVLAGDAAAERVLYEDHVGRVYRLSYRMTGDENLAEDFTQETFLRAFDRLPDFRGQSALSTWLHSITVSVVINGLRKIKRFRQRETSLDSHSGAGIGPGTGVGTGQGAGRGTGHNARTTGSDLDLKLLLHRAIDNLADGLRLVFVMHDIEGYKHREIADILAVPEGTSKSRLASAREQLRQALSGAGKQPLGPQAEPGPLRQKEQS